MKSSIRLFSLDRLLPWACPGWAAPRWLLLGFIVVGMAFSERVEAHSCSDGSSFYGLWTSSAANVASRTTSGGDFYGVSHFQFSWRLTVETGSGHAYVSELVGRGVYIAGGTTAWFADVAPTRMPTGAYLAWACQVQATTDTAASCRLDCYLTNYDFFESDIAGYHYEVDLGWLTRDADSDTVPNLYDPDHFLECTGDIFSSAGCTQPFEGVESGELGGVYDPPEATGVPGMPVTAGGWATQYACDDVLATGGATMPEFSADTAQTLTEYNKWAKKYWREPGFFGLPATPKPYEGAYNLVRGGAGGGESAYFSAVWGKRVTYLLAGSHTNFYSAVRLGGSTYWHRYVLFDDGQVSFQYYHPGSSCWKKLGVAWPGDIWPTNPTHQPITGLVSWAQAGRLIPNGYEPGDVVGETGSNIAGGQYRLPAYTAGSSYYTYLGSVAPEGVGSGSGGAGLSASDLETAFGNALRAAGVGGEGGGGIDGEGAWDSAGDAFGMVGVGDGGVSTGIEEGIGEAGSEASEGFSVAMGLDEVMLSPGTIEGVFTFDIPIPGYGAYTAELSTLPDTSTATGAALDVCRVLIRTAIGLWWSIVLCLKLIAMYKEIT